MKKTTKQVFLVLIGVVLIFCMSLGVVFGASQSLTTWSATDYDEDFPLNLTPVVDESSVQFIRQLEPITLNNITDLPSSEEPESSLNTALLCVNLQGSAKNEKSELNQGYHLTIQKNAQTLLDGNYAKEDSFSLADLIRGEIYDIYIKIENQGAATEYIGNFYFDLDVDDIVFISLDYEKVDTPAIQMFSVTATNESESNGTTATADAFNWGKTVKGTVSSNSDIDYFKVTNPSSVNTKMSCMFKNTGTGGTMYYQIYYRANSTSSLVLQRTITQNAGTNSYYALPMAGAGEYFIKVYRTATIYTGTSYSFNINIASMKSWYSQIAGYSGSIHYWNTERLDQLYIPSYSTNVFIDNDPNTKYGDSNADIMTKGCFLSCIAMVLRNQSKTYNCFDFRMQTSGAQMADPFTAMLANNGKNGTEVLTKSSTRYELPGISANPVNIASASALCAKFGAVFHSKDLRNLSASAREAEIANLTNQINGSGIILSLDNGSHFVVATTYSAGSTSLASRMRVCDSGTNNPSAGDNVYYSASHSKSRAIPGTGSSGITYIYWITVS